MKFLTFQIILIGIFIQNIYSGSKDFDTLLKWGKKNGLVFSDKIEMNYTSENIKNYVVKEEIPKNESIMTIPTELLLNIKNALSLAGPKMKKAYEKYQKAKFEYTNDFLQYRIQQSFIAYLMYSANKYKSDKNQFYQFYKNFFNTFETNLDSNPLLYNAEQFNLLTSTLVGNEIFQIKTLFEEELNILNKKIFPKKKIDYDEYFRYRIFTLSKGKNISDAFTIIPFADMMDVHPSKYNIKLRINLGKYGIKLITTKKIKPGKPLLFKIDTMSNSNYLIFYGKTFEEMENKANTFPVPYVSPLYLKERNLDESWAINEKIDLAREKFYEEAMKTYMDFSKKIKEDGSPLSALRIFKGNLMTLRKKYDEISTSKIHKTFFTLRDIENIKRLVDTEKFIYDQKLTVIDTLIDFTINNNTKKEDNETVGGTKYQGKDENEIDLDL